jgi:ribosomal protein S18
MDFYDETIEKDKLFFDAVSVLKHGDLNKMSLAKSSKTWLEVEDDKNFTRDFDLKPTTFGDSEEVEDEFSTDLTESASGEDGLGDDEHDGFSIEEDNDDDDDEKDGADDRYNDDDDQDLADGELAEYRKLASTNRELERQMVDANDHEYMKTLDERTFDGAMESDMFATDLADHVGKFKGADFIPTEALDFSRPQRYNPGFPDPRKEPFYDDSDRDKYRWDEQGLRSCKGKMQRKGFHGTLKCHLIDLDALSHYDVSEMSRFITEASEIAPREQSGLCAKCQRKVTRAAVICVHDRLTSYRVWYNTFCSGRRNRQTGAAFRHPAYARANRH